MTKSTDESILAQAKKHYESAKNGWSEIYSKADDDLRFLSDEPGAQWDEKVYAERLTAGQPTISIDHCTQFVHQVVNDARMNTPTIKAIPHSGGSDVKTAEVIDGIIKDIEYESGADEAYDTAITAAVKCSIGFIRIDHDYVDDETFDQRLCIKRIVNHKSILIDPSIIEIDGSDAKYGFVFDPISVAEFRSLYPNANPCSFGDDASSADRLSDDDEIQIADYYVIEESKKTIAVDVDGNVVDAADGTEYTQTRTVKTRKVRRYKLSGSDVLAGGGEHEYFPGQYIPIVPVFGEEAWRDGKRHLHSLIRKAKSPAYMNNLWKSLETETLIKQPLAPVMALAGQVEAFKDDWLNPTKAAVLRYEAVDINGQLAPAPQRLSPPMFPAGFAQASRSAIDDIKSTTGLYNAALGMRSNEQSGVAIAQRKVEGDVATFHFGDNLVKSITQVGRILVAAMPEVYDNARIVRMIDAEENPKMIGINGAMAEGQKEAVDLKKGKYSTRVTTGAPFTTQRQEAAQTLSEIGARNPQLYQIAGDILFKNMDFPGAQALAERFKKTIPKELLEPEDGEDEIDPEKMQMQQVIQQGQQMIAQMQQEMAAMKQQLDSKQADLALKAQTEHADNQLQLMKLQIEQEKNKTDAKLKAAEIALKDRELHIRELEIAARNTAPIPPQNLQ